MFQNNYDTARVEVARRHERLHAAQRSGLAYEPRTRRQVALAARLRSWFTRAPRVATEPTTPATAPSDPCVTC